MPSCRRFRGLLIDAAYGELDRDAQQLLDEHRQRCPGCAAELSQLRATIAALPSRAVDEAPLDRVWQRLAPELEPKVAAGWWWLRPRLVVAATVAAVAVVLLIALGDRQPGDLATEPVIAAVEPEARAFESYLNRAQPLLLAISHADPELAANPTVQRAERLQAAVLAEEAARLREGLGEQADRRDELLLVALETLFLQLANLPEAQYPQGREALRASLGREALLLGIDAVELRSGPTT